MTIETERRLVDLFDAMDRQLDDVGPLPLDASTAPRTTHRARRVLAAVAAAAVLVLAVAALVLDDDGPRSADVAAGPPVTISDARFDEVAAQVCVELDQARAGIRPRFATAEAYLVAARSRTAAIDAAAATLGALPAPASDPTLPSSAVAALRRARDDLRPLEDAARAGRLDEAAERWASLDPAIDDAVRPLGVHGAAACRR